MQHAWRHWRQEKRAAALYRALSDLESGTPRQLLFLELAKDADSEAMTWELEMKKAGLPAPLPYAPGMGVRLTMRLLPWIGAASMSWLLAAWGLKGLSVLGTPNLPAGQNQAARPASQAYSRTLTDTLYGMHDGLLALLCLLLLMAGADVRPDLMMFAGVAGLLAGALAMAAGISWSGRGRSADGEELLPDLRELAAAYARRGMEREAATQQARQVLLDLELLAPDQPLTILRPEADHAGWQPALVAFFSFAGGAAVPLLPYLLEVQRHPLMMGCSIALVSLFVTGWLLAEAAGRVALWGGLRTVALGLAGSSLSYLAGTVLVALL